MRSGNYLTSWKVRLEKRRIDHRIMERVEVVKIERNDYHGIPDKLQHRLISAANLIFNLTKFEIGLHGAVGLIYAERTVHHKVKVIGERSWIHGVAIGICFVILFHPIPDDHSVRERI